MPLLARFLVPTTKCKPPVKRLLIGDTLLRWYKQAGRDLPWRTTDDPYAIWVSEIMLQQTQVATVIPYYNRFLARFPTVQILAMAPLDHVLKIWEGMGYYARARSLLLAAQKIVEQFGGNMPRSHQELYSLPGIGRSTAGAILNIAHLQRHPILDGNVKRILVRYFCIRANPKEKKVEAKLWRLAEQILPVSHVNSFTQAIMDLGALICLPRRPNCPLCPVQSGCQAYQKGMQYKLPLKSVTKKVPHFDHVAAVIQNGNKVLIKKRPEKGLLGGLWEFPGGRVIDGTDCNRMIEKEIGQNLRLTPWFEIKHTFTHFKMTLHLFRGKIGSDKMGSGQIGTARIPSPFQWAMIHQLSEYPFSSAHKKIVIKLQNE